jgi:hypothetical protein
MSEPIQDNDNYKPHAKNYSNPSMFAQGEILILVEKSAILRIVSYLRDNFSKHG